MGVYLGLFVCCVCFVGFVEYECFCDVVCVRVFVCERICVSVLRNTSRKSSSSFEGETSELRASSERWQRRVGLLGPGPG